MGTSERKRNIATFTRQAHNLVPSRRYIGQKIGPQCHDLRSGIKRQRPVLSRKTVARQRRADACTGQCCNDFIAEHILQRKKAVAGNGLSYMRMIENHEIIAGAKIGNRVRFKAFKRLLIPMDIQA